MHDGFITPTTLKVFQRYGGVKMPCGHRLLLSLDTSLALTGAVALTDAHNRQSAKEL